MVNWDNPLAEWYEYHKEDYVAVRQRLDVCRNILLHGRKEAAVTLLKKSHINSVLSIQTERERHERAFTAYYAGDTSLESACQMTTYGNQKAGWIHGNLSAVNWESLIEHIRGQVFAGNPVAAVDKLQSEVTGLSWVKGGFTLAMLGIYEVACPDSRTRQQLGIEKDRIKSETAYRQALDEIDNSFGAEIPTFLKQWVCYDVYGGEHATHDPFFTEVLRLYQRSNH